MPQPAIAMKKETAWSLSAGSTLGAIATCALYERMSQDTAEGSGANVTFSFVFLSLFVGGLMTFCMGFAGMRYFLRSCMSKPDLEAPVKLQASSLLGAVMVGTGAGYGVSTITNAKSILAEVSVGTVSAVASAALLECSTPLFQSAKNACERARYTCERRRTAAKSVTGQEQRLLELS